MSVSQQVALSAPAQRNAAMSSHEEILRNTTEAVGIGRTTLQRLNQQEEMLRSAEDNVDSNQHIIQQSQRVLRGMTWSGYFYNMFTSEPPKVQTGLVASSVGNSGPQLPRTETTNSPQDAKAGVDIIKSSSNKSSTSSKLQAQDDALLEVSRSLGELHQIGISMGETLDSHNQSLDRLGSKTKALEESTLEVLLRSSQLISRSNGGHAEYLGEYRLEVTFPKRGFFGVVDDRLVIHSRPDLSTAFRIFAKENHIFGLQSIMSLRYLATGTFVSISAHSFRFNKSAESYLDLSGDQTGIFFLDFNWGGGGWLKFIDDDYGFKLSAGVGDKNQIALFRAVCIGKNPPKEGG